MKARLFRRVKEHKLPLETVINAFKTRAHSDGPCERVARYLKHTLDLFNDLEGIPTLAVHFVDEGEDRNTAHAADVKKLDGLGLHAFGDIDHHDRAVGRHECAIGVFREILVARSIEKIDAKTFVVELQNARGNRNPTLPLELHPIRNSLASMSLCRHLARLVNGATVQQCFFGERGLTGVGVRNNGKSTASQGFLETAFFENGILRAHAGVLSKLRDIDDT